MAKHFGTLLSIDHLATPIGELIVIADGDGALRTIDWTDHEARMKLLLDRYYGKGPLHAPRPSAIRAG